jgi:hypothetical protein
VNARKIRCGLLQNSVAKCEVEQNLQEKQEFMTDRIDKIHE